MDLIESCALVISPSGSIHILKKPVRMGMIAMVWRFLQLAARRRSLLLPLGALSGLAVLALAPGAAQAALFTVTKDKWGTSADEGSFAWAIEQANLSGGPDVIAVTDGLQINVDDAIATSPFNLATISESVTILGNNARLVGNPSFLIQPATIVTKDNPQKPFYPQGAYPAIPEC